LKGSQEEDNPFQKEKQLATKHKNQMIIDENISLGKRVEGLERTGFLGSLRLQNPFKYISFPITFLFSNPFSTSKKKERKPLDLIFRYIPGQRGVVDPALRPFYITLQKKENNNDKSHCIITEPPVLSIKGPGQKPHHLRKQ